jgi:hypothetical protein
MQHLFQSSKRLISMCLVTLLLVTSTLVSFPAPARAAGNVSFINCESGSDCGNLAAFSVGVATGSAVTILATGGGHALAEAAMIVIGAGTAAAAPPAAAAVPAIAAAAPVAVPVALTAVAGYAAYNFLTSHQNDQTQTSQ